MTVSNIAFKISRSSDDTAEIKPLVMANTSKTGSTHMTFGPWRAGKGMNRDHSYRYHFHYNYNNDNSDDMMIMIIVVIIISTRTIIHLDLC